MPKKSPTEIVGSHAGLGMLFIIIGLAMFAVSIALGSLL